MKKILTSVLLLATVGLFSCKSGGGDPKDVLSDFFDALSKKDIAKARTLATKESKDMLDMMDMAMKMDNKESKDSEYDKANMEMGDAKIEGEQATVPVKDKKSGQTVNYVLKKEDGKWKVAFDKGTMMNMGAESMEGLSEEDKEELNSIDVDSLKESINQSLDMAVDTAAAVTQ